MNVMRALHPQQLVDIIRTHSRRLGAETSLADDVTSLWNAGLNILTDAVNLPSYMVVKGVTVVSQGMSQAYSEAVQTGAHGSAAAIDELGTRFSEMAKAALTNYGAGIAALIDQAGGSWWDTFGTPIMVGVGAALLLLGGMGFLLTTGGGQAVLTGGGAALKGGGAALGRAALVV